MTPKNAKNHISLTLRRGSKYAATPDHLVADINFASWN